MVCRGFLFNLALLAALPPAEVRLAVAAARLELGEGLGARPLLNRQKYSKNIAV